MVARMCRVPMPVAFTPSWQETHVSTMPVWSKLAGFHATVEWQVSQPAVVAMWVEVLPTVFVPSWQETQVPMTCV